MTETASNVSNLQTFLPYIISVLCALTKGLDILVTVSIDATILKNIFFIFHRTFQYFIFAYCIYIISHLVQKINSFRTFVKYF